MEEDDDEDDGDDDDDDKGQRRNSHCTNHVPEHVSCHCSSVTYVPRAFRVFEVRSSSAESRSVYLQSLSRPRNF